MSKDLPALLRAAIEQRKALAEEASPSPWSANAEGTEVVAVDGITVCDGFALSSRQLRATVSHIVANDPKTIIEHCRADLRLLAWYEAAQRTAERNEADRSEHNYAADTAGTLREVIEHIAEGYGIA